MKIKSLWSVSIAATLLAGCGSGAIIAPGDGGDDNGGGDGGEILKVDQPPEVIAAVSSFFREKCVDCHGRARTEGDISDILDVEGLKAKGLIGESAEGSRLFQVIKEKKHQKDSFNPRTERPVVLPTDQEIQFVRTWIDMGAPPLRGDREVLDLGRYLQLLRNDLNEVSRAEQNQVVYVDFHAAYNNKRFADAGMQALANATLKLLNQLDVESSSAGRSNVSVVLDKNGVPAGVRFNPARFHLDKQKDIIDIIVRLSNRNDAENAFPCDVPAIPVLDFLHIASSDDVFNPLNDLGTGALGAVESAYSNIVLKKLLVKAGVLNADQEVFRAIDEATYIKNGFTNKAENFNVFDVLFAIDPVNFTREQLRITYNEGNDRQRFVRGCMVQSKVSAGNRCIDRMSQSSPPNGSTYLSYDILSTNNGKQGKDFFAAAFLGPANPTDDPLVVPTEGRKPFLIDGGEGIFQLPNRMLGFFIYNANFEVLSNPPTFAVLNNDNDERGSVISASACTSCHSNYTNPFEDQIKVTIDAFKDSARFDELGFADKFSITRDEWRAKFALDAQDYVSALRGVYVAYKDGNDLPDGIWSLGKQYMSDLTVDDAAAELGFADKDELLSTINNDLNLSSVVNSLFAGAISRENFVFNYQRFVNVAPGNADFLRGCVQRDASDVGDFGNE